VNYVNVVEQTLRELWLHGATQRELSKTLGVSPSSVHNIIVHYGLPPRARGRRYGNGWLYCGSCHRFIHSSVAIPHRRGFLCPICHKPLRRKPKP
jgi:hypothetical protein